MEEERWEKVKAKSEEKVVVAGLLTIFSHERRDSMGKIWGHHHARVFVGKDKVWRDPVTVSFEKVSFFNLGV